MGASKSYMGKPGWAGDQSNRGREPKYTSKPAARMEGTHMSGENDYGRKGAKSQANKSGTFAGPKNRKPADSGY